jgi:hypothetical protein
VDYIVNDAFDVVGSLIPSYEAFVQQLVKSRPASAIIFVLSCPLEICRSVRDVILWISSLYDLPIISFFDVVQCAVHISGRSNVTETYWRGLHHPDWVTHQLMADTLSFVFFQNTICHIENNHQLTPKSQLDKLEMCHPPSSSYSAYEVHSSSSSSSSSSGSETPHAHTHQLHIFHNMSDYSSIQMTSWKLREDRKGKPGWIATSPEHWISFPLRFGDHPRLVVSYLKSYKGLGKVRMTLNNRSVELTGLYTVQEQPYNVSQVATQVFEVWRTDSFQGMWNFPFGFAVSPNSLMPVKFSADGALNPDGVYKFKIVSVLSC